MTSTFDVQSKDGLKLKFYRFGVHEPKATLCMVHGMGDHAHRHRSLVEYMNRQGLAVLAFDQRGHGHSEGLRGHAPSYSLLMEDVQVLLGQAQKYYPGIPTILYGHSMGGNLVLNYAIRLGIGADVVVASSPWLQLAFQPAPWKVALAKVVYRVFPRLQQQTGLDSSQLSHDPIVTTEYRNDPLVHNKITAAFYVYLLEAAEWAIAHAHQLKVPAFLLHGTGDEITSMEGTKAFVEQSNGKATIKLFDALYHEMHHEKEKDAVFGLILDWCRIKLDQ